MQSRNIVQHIKELHMQLSACTISQLICSTLQAITVPLQLCAWKSMVTAFIWINTWINPCVIGSTGKLQSLAAACDSSCLRNALALVMPDDSTPSHIAAGARMQQGRSAFPDISPRSPQRRRDTGVGAVGVCRWVVWAA